MKINEYQDLAMRTLNPNLNKKDVLINAVMGLCGESGEAIDLVKKHLAQGHDFDKEKFAEAAYAIDMDLESILAGNIEKLKKRFPLGFSSEKSINREE